MRATPDVAGATPTSARRRRERRTRSFFRHEQMAVHMAVISALHHSAHRCCSVATQIDDEMLAATFAATASPAATYTATRAPDAPAPVFEYVALAPGMENVAPATSVILPVPSQQLPPIFFTATVATDVNFDVTGLVSPQFSGTALEASAPQAVVSVPPFEELTEPEYNQVHQEQIVTGEMTLNSVEHPVVQEQAPQFVGSLPPLEEFTDPVYNQVYQEQIVPVALTEALPIPMAN